ncbi:Nup85 nucleoporin-domain-containing protein [Multifurca ochricompacta]|uniref:Nuclear pore complex protein Nup85 n=1 Tax=Multifurca ochricompacta TaxID=376703 RepID=A0AAD4QKK2_9AGAM|nr:Nup85 nucleoporin-domain-containing protein [Multifurca ochricompacta]
MTTIRLYPPLFEEGKEIEFVRSGRTLSAIPSPRDNSVAVFSTSAVDPQTLKSLNEKYTDSRDIYTASTDKIPTSERRLFVTDTSVIFASLQDFKNSNKTSDLDSRLGRSEQVSPVLIKHAVDYVKIVVDSWARASKPVNRPRPLQYDANHYRTLYTCLSLFVVLYLPEAGFDDAPVGEELMEWLNTHFIEPSSEEGDHLSSQDKPWQDDTFWPYLTRSVLRGFSKAPVFLLETLSRHPSEHLQNLVNYLSPLLSSHPRILQFSTEREFVVALRRWKERVKTLRLELDQVPEEEREDDFENWWKPLSNIVGILEGRLEIIQNICIDLNADWKEVCATWSIFVNHRLRRQDLPEVVNQVLESMPPDPTDLEDMIHVALFRGEIMEALSHAAKLDIWLAAHWIDLMEHLDLLNTHAGDDLEISIRDQYILSYADYLHSDPALWRITVAYMCSCGSIGKEQADQVLLRVPVDVNRGATGPSDVHATVSSGEVPEALRDVIETCHEYGRESVRRMVCTIAAQNFLRRREYGLAVSYTTSAENWTWLGRIVDAILAEYIKHGPEVFARSVAAVAPSLQELRAHPGADGVFTHRLMFAVRYAEFHQRRLSGDLQEAALDILTMFNEDLAPKMWWGVLLCDAVELVRHDSLMLYSSSGAVELLKRLEEVNLRASQGSGDDYLSVLMVTMKGATEGEVLQRLKSARLSLAKYYAKCTMVAGGRDVTRLRAGIIAV